MTPCSVDSCVNEAKKGGLCWGHLRRRKLGQSMSAPLEEHRGRPPADTNYNPWERIKAAAVRFADDTEAPAGENPREAMRRAEQRYHKALYTYFVTKRGRLVVTTREGKKR